MVIRDMQQTCLKILGELPDPKGWKKGKKKVTVQAEFTCFYICYIAEVFRAKEHAFIGWTIAVDMVSSNRTV